MEGGVIAPERSTIAAASPWEEAQPQLDRAAGMLELDAGMREMLLHPRRTTALNAVVACARRHGTDLRTGALCPAVGRVVDAHQARGLYP